MQDRDRIDSPSGQESWLKRNQTLVVVLILGFGAAAFFMAPKLRPQVTIPGLGSIPSGGSNEIQKLVTSILTPSNIVSVSNTLTGLLSNFTVPQAPAQGPTPIAGPPTAPAVPVVPKAGPPPVSQSTTTGRPTLELYLMNKKGQLPESTEASLARITDSSDLFRSARFKEDPQLGNYQDKNLWMKWQGKLKVVNAGKHFFVHAVNMNRIPPPGGAVRAPDYGGRGRQEVFTHLYIDAKKVSTESGRFSAIQASQARQFDADLSAGFHDVTLWLGIWADGAKHLYDETSVSLGVRTDGQPLPVKVTATDLAW